MKVLTIGFMTIAVPAFAGSSENIEKIEDICQRTAPLVEKGTDKYGNVDFTEAPRKKHRTCQRCEANKMRHLLDAEEKQIIGIKQ